DRRGARGGRLQPLRSAQAPGAARRRAGRGARARRAARQPPDGRLRPPHRIPAHLGEM
ncbi:MAG: Cyclic pyranopterin phosphate synthase (MoaA), partial [uncultured Gemmatimonadetes bacterium]